MITALALAVPFHPWGFGRPGLWFLGILLLVVLVVAIVFAITGRRHRRGPWGPGPWGAGPGGAAAWQSAQAARSAESTLAERFANGDIDEKEYRARLEVLRANAAPPVS